MKLLSQRVQEIRLQIEGETISYAEIAELECLASSNPELFIGDTLLSEWAGIPEKLSNPF
jgi:hypothetical protein